MTQLILKYFPEFCLCHHPITILIKQFEGSPDLKNLVMNMKSRKTHVITKCEKTHFIMKCEKTHVITKCVKTHFITKCSIFLKANFKQSFRGSNRDKNVFALVGWESEEKEYCTENTFSSACWRVSGSEESNLSTRPKSSRKR